MFLSAQEVHVWRVSLRQPAQAVASLDDCLDEVERERADRFRMPDRRAVARVSRGTLKQILARYLGASPRELRLRENDHGKPYLEGDRGRLRFNLSHSRDWAIVGVTLDAEIGVDVEAIDDRRRTVELAERYFSAAERSELSALPEDVRLLAFYCGWTRKEAYIKARGRGLSLPLDSFDVTLDPTIEPRLTRAADDPQFSRWRFKALPAPQGFVAAAIVEGAKTRWTLGEWSPAAGAPAEDAAEV